MLDERQIKCVELLAQGIPIAEVSRQLDVSRQTIYNWKENKEFTDELDKLGQEYISSAQSHLKYAAKDAADVIIKLLKKGKSEKTRLTAAVDILVRNLGKATTKLEVSDKKSTDQVPKDILEDEFNEVDNNNDE